MPVNSFENYPMSWKPRRTDDGEPLYLMIARQLESDIRNGDLLPGTKLPPQRELADYLDVNVSTISRAFGICSRKGLLGGTVGSGTFVAYDALANINVTPQDEGGAIIEMGSVMPERTSYEEISAVLKKMLAEPDFGRFLHYGAAAGSLWQRETAVRLLRKTGCETTEDRLLPANGGQNAIAAIVAGLFRPGDCIGVDPMTYPGIKSVAKLLGVRLIPIGQEGGEICEEGLIHACDNAKIKAVYIMPDYQNPTTHTMSDEGREMIARTAKERDLLIIEDAIHSLLAPRPNQSAASRAPEHTVHIASLSKTVSPGLRLCYIATPPRYKDALSDSLYSLNLTGSPFLLEIASRVIASGSAETIAARHRELAMGRNAVVNEMLAGYDLRGADECIFRWLLLPGGWSGERFESAASAAGVRVYGAERFAVGKAKPAAAVRLAIAAPESIEELKEGVRRLLVLLRKEEVAKL